MKMMSTPKQIDQQISLRELYPDLSEQELEEAEENLERYIELVLRIHERIRLDPKAYAEFKALTASDKGIKLQDRSNPS